MEFDNYASHLHVFERSFGTFEKHKVLEFGLGEFSTQFFVDRADAVVSVEQESREWYDKLRAQITSSNWHPIFQPDPRVVFEHFDANHQNFDLVSSDGAAETRCLIANMAMERNIPVVVLHDAEKVWYYRWNLLNIPADYGRFNFRHREGLNKVTTVLANQHQTVLEGWNISDHDRILQAYSSPEQPVIEVHYNQFCDSSNKFDRIS